jgi:hypothetical protein
MLMGSYVKNLGLKFLEENQKHNDLWNILCKAGCCFSVVEDKVPPNAGSRGIFCVGITLPVLWCGRYIM